MDDCYYLDATRNQRGPVPGDEIARLIRSGTIRRDTMIWCAGMPDWQPAGQVNDFASLFARAAPPPRVPPSRGSFAGAAPLQPTTSMRRAQSGHIEPRMGLGTAIATCFRKYVDFTGRARRKEYWYWHLFYWLVIVGLVLLDVIMVRVGAPPVFTFVAVLAILVFFLPTLAGTVRRLHDTDHSGWMIFISWIPIVGPIIFIVFMCKRGTEGPNRFGPDPLGADVAAAFD